MVEISEDATLYTPEEAQRVGIKIKGAEQEVQVCPVCNKVPCVCDEDDDDGDGDDGSPNGSSAKARPPRRSRRSPTSATTMA